MIVLDPGHKYQLAHLDGYATEILTFVKRKGDNYPGNLSSYEGTNMQEVLRALIDRIKYVNNQIPCSQNEIVLLKLREVVLLLEERAAIRHKREPIRKSYEIELLSTCDKCGHIGCSGECH